MAPAPRRVVYLRRSDGIIQRYRTKRNPAEFSNRVSKAEYLRQRRELADIRDEKRDARRAAKKASTPPPIKKEAQPPERVARRRGVPAHLVEYRTFFKAAGTMRPDLNPPEDPFGMYPDTQDPPPFGEGTTGPAYFYSNSATTGGTGQVYWEGIVPLERLISDLNWSLYITDKQGRHRDFRSVYPRWSLRYIVIERVSAAGSASDRIIEDISRSSGVRRRRRR